MKNKNYIFFSFFLLFTIAQIGCNSINEEYENRSKTCNLKLYERENYDYKFPNFLGQTYEKGTYIIQDTNLILKRKEKNDYPESKFSTIYLYKNPTTLKLTFDNLNREPIDVELKIKKWKGNFSSVSNKWRKKKDGTLLWRNKFKRRNRME